jgi:hypothetical protein
VLAEPDGERALRRTARNAREVKERAGTLFKVLRGAALADPYAAELWDRIQAEFHDNQRTIVAAIAKRRGLREGLSVDDAADILWTINHPNTWQLLVGERSWTADQYEQWAVDLACRELLRRGAGSA